MAGEKNWSSHQQRHSKLVHSLQEDEHQEPIYNKAWQRWLMSLSKDTGDGEGLGFWREIEFAYLQLEGVRLPKNFSNEPKEFSVNLSINSFHQNFSSLNVRQFSHPSVHQWHCFYYYMGYMWRKISLSGVFWNNWSSLYNTNLSLAEFQSLWSCRETQLCGIWHLGGSCLRVLNLTWS